MMRILIFNWRDPDHPWAGGAEVFLHEVGRRWIQQGHTVTWFCARFPGQQPQIVLDGIEIIRQGGVYSVYLQSVRWYLTQFSRHYDVILDSANGIPFFTPLFSRMPKVIMVHHVHREVFFYELPPVMARMGHFIEAVGMPLIYHRDHYLTVSESSRNSLMDLGVPQERISVVYNGVDHSLYSPGIKSSKPLIAYVGRLRNYKSIHVLIQAMPELLDTIPDLNLVIAGSGEALAGLQRLAEKTGVSQQVTFLGHVSQAEKVYLLQEAHVVVNPSLKEGWGISVIEANSCGTPVVGSNVCGLCDSILDGQTGLLFLYGDSHALAGCLKALLLDGRKQRQLSEAAQEWSRCFDWDRTAADCMEVLEIAQKKKPGR
jgi:glycosyltransferase involved in cell wall biosynthesis